MLIPYRHIFYNPKIIYTLIKPIKKTYKKSYKRLFTSGYIYIRTSKNNMFLTSTRYRQSKVIASFSSKMFKDVEGRRKSFAMILAKKIGFVTGFKSVMNNVVDVRLVYRIGMRMRRFKFLLHGLCSSGIKFRRLKPLRKNAHNGCRGKIRRRL